MVLEYAEMYLTDYGLLRSEPCFEMTRRMDGCTQGCVYVCLMVLYKMVGLARSRGTFDQEFCVWSKSVLKS